ncbi:ribbon-helix-helix domain-containing protein (plasmid) [Rhizobium leguminosarum]
MIRPQSEFAAECRGLPRRLNLGKDGRDAERVTTTLTRTQKAELDRLAKAQGVKIAWLVRRAVERFLEESAGGPMLPFDSQGGEDAKR